MKSMVLNILQIIWHFHRYAIQKLLTLPPRRKLKWRAWGEQTLRLESFDFLGTRVKIRDLKVGAVFSTIVSCDF